MDKKNYNANFIDLLKDDEFVKQVVKAENPELLIEELILQNKENSKAISYAFEFVRLTKTDKRSLSLSDSDEILRNIERRLHVKNSGVRPLYYLSKMRVASVILILITLGATFLYFQHIHDPLKNFAQRNIADADQSLIVLSDGSKQSIKNNDSYIEFGTEDNSVLVKRNNNLVDKLDNKKDHGVNVLNQVIVPFGQRQTISLCDGSIVHLNAGSKLTFPSEFSGKTRDVYLQGEGLFEVSKNPEQPFIVKTDYVDVKVLGTIFDVSAYEDEEIASTVLVEGSVNVSQKNKVFNNQSYNLTPGEACFYMAKEQKSEIRKVDTDFYTSWKDGLYRFKDTRLLDVVRRLKKYYNVQIQLEGETIANTLISGKLVLSDEIAEVMQYLTKTIEGRYEKKEDGIYIIRN